MVLAIVLIASVPIFVTKEKIVAICTSKQTPYREIALTKANYILHNHYLFRDTAAVVHTKSYVFNVKIADFDTYCKDRSFFGIAYPLGFVLSINGSTALTSPNIIKDDSTNTFHIVYPHSCDNQDFLECFYNVNKTLLKASNTFELTVVSTCEDTLYVPQWELMSPKRGYFFSVPTLFCASVASSPQNSALPSLHFSVHKDIPDEPKVPGTLKVLDGDTSQFAIKIETRGFSSQSQGWPRYNYSFGIYKNNKRKKKVALLGLPAHSKWVLNISYADKSMVRNALTYHIASKMNQHVSHFVFCNVYINHEYMGVYMLLEKPEPKNEKHVDEEYFVEANRPNNKEIGWVLDSAINVNIVKPKKDKITKSQKDSVVAFFAEVNNAFKNTPLDYHKIDSIIDTDEFIDYILINELTRNIDSYMFSTYFSIKKYTDQNRAKLTVEPVWDYDLSYGNCLLCGYFNPSGWITQTSIKRICWAQKMIDDPHYSAIMKKRWAFYRKSFCCLDSICTYIDDAVAVIGSSKEAYFENVRILDTWVWPNAFVGQSYQNEIYFLKSWIASRLYWMNTQLGYANTSN